MAASAIISAVTPKVIAPAPVTSTAVKPIGPTPSTVTPIKPVTPGGISPISPVKPVVPGAVLPVAPGQTPLKPTSATPVPLAGTDKKSGTAVIKNAPPKETARITVKPSLPSLAAGAGQPIAKAATPSVATTVASVKGSDAAKSRAATVPLGAPATGSIRFEEPAPAESTTTTTILAGALAVLTWGIGLYLLGSAYGYF